MANTVLGRAIIINSSNQFLMPKVDRANLGGGGTLQIKGVSLVMTTTDAVLQLGIGDSLGASVIMQLDKYNLFVHFDDLWLEDVMVTTISNGTGFLYFG